jgi:hypothetical protein
MGQSGPGGGGGVADEQLFFFLWIDKTSHSIS